MIRGIGVDMCEIERLQDKGPESSFVKRFFTPEEQAYLQSRGAAYARSLAGLYAAKEAYAKALGCGIRGFALQEVEILHTPEGQPYYRPQGQALVRQLERGIEEVLLSISHEAGLALAFALARGGE